MPKKKRSVSVDFDEEQQRRPDDHSGLHDIHDANIQLSKGKKEPKIRKNELWTRLIHVGVTENREISFFDVQAEIDHAVANPVPMPKRKNFTWSLLFDPEVFEKENKDADFDKFILSPAELKKVAVKISDYRSQFRKQAFQMLSGQNISSESRIARMKRLGKQVEWNHHKTPNKLLGFPKEKLIEEIPPGLGRTNRRAQPLTAMNKLEIAHQVLAKQEKMSDVAKEFRTSLGVVSMITKKAKNNLAEIINAIDVKHKEHDKNEELATLIQRLKDTGVTLNSAEDVKVFYELNHSDKVTLREAKYVMKSILDMGFTKIVRQNIHANTERCLFSRQQSALGIL